MAHSLIHTLIRPILHFPPISFSLFLIASFTRPVTRLLFAEIRRQQIIINGKWPLLGRMTNCHFYRDVDFISNSLASISSSELLLKPLKGRLNRPRILLLLKPKASLYSNAHNETEEFWNIFLVVRRRMPDLIEQFFLFINMILFIKSYLSFVRC